MWIEHIGTIGMIAVVVLVAAHFALHFYFKNERKKKIAKEEAEKKD